jgi:hypothetical protein
MTMPRRLRAILKYDKNKIPLLLVLAQSIYAKMLANQVLYPAPPVSLATLSIQIKDLGDTQQGVKQRTVRASVRNAKRDVLVTTLETLRMYVQGLVDTSPEQGNALIEQAGMTVAAVPARSKPILAAKVGKLSGVVLLIANAGLLGKSKRQRCYNWQYTVNNGAAWVSAPPTPYARTTITGLPPLTSVGFRVSITDVTGQGEWTQVVSIVVH